MYVYQVKYGYGYFLLRIVWTLFVPDRAQRIKMKQKLFCSCSIFSMGGKKKGKAVSLLRKTRSYPHVVFLLEPSLQSSAQFVPELSRSSTARPCNMNCFNQCLSKHQTLQLIFSGLSRLNKGLTKINKTTIHMVLAL